MYFQTAGCNRTVGHFSFSSLHNFVKRDFSNCVFATAGRVRAAFLVVGPRRIYRVVLERPSARSDSARSQVGV